MSREIIGPTKQQLVTVDQPGADLAILVDPGNDQLTGNAGLVEQFRHVQAFFRVGLTDTLPGHQAQFGPIRGQHGRIPAQVTEGRGVRSRQARIKAALVRHHRVDHKLVGDQIVDDLADSVNFLGATEVTNQGPLEG